jgi:hypothetical protein
MVFFSEHEESCLFAFAHAVVDGSLLDTIDPANLKQAVDVLFKEIAVDVCRWFQKFGHGCFEVIRKKLTLKPSSELYTAWWHR